MSNKDAPCKGCKDRHVGCHSGCEMFAEYKKNIEAIKKVKDGSAEFWIPLQSSKDFKKRQNTLQKCGRRWRQ